MENNSKQIEKTNQERINGAFDPDTIDEIHSKKLIYLRCVFVKIYKVDTVNENYYAEIFLQAKWREPLLDIYHEIKHIDLSKYWNPKLHIENIITENKTSISLEVSYSAKEGVAYLIEKRRVKAAFHEILELKHFPFDCQDLSVVVTTEFSSEDVELIESPHDPSKINSSDGIESQEWSLYVHVEVESTKIQNDCNIGPKVRPVMTFTCRASRRFRYFLINHFLISSMFFLLTFTSFAISSTNAYGRLQLCMTTLLTSVTFKVAVSQSLPKIPYLTYLDKTILGNIFMIMCVCMWHASTSIFFFGTNVSLEVTAEKIRQIEILLIPSLLCFYGITVLLYSLIIYYDAGSRRRLMVVKDANFEKNIKKSGNVDVPCDVC